MADPKISGPSPGLTRRGAATRERIVATAADLMYIHGVAGTSLADVMAGSGTGTSQLYHYFADKDALVAEVVGLQIERTLATQQRRLERVDSRRGLLRWRDAELQDARSTQRYGCTLGSLASELSCRSDQSRHALAEAFGTWEGYLRGALERMQGADQIADDADPASLAVGLLAALQGGLLLSQTTSDASRLAHALDVALAQLPSTRD